MIGLLVVLLAQSAFAAIIVDFNCTEYGTEWTYTAAATNCENTISDAACAILYPPVDPAVAPAPGGSDARAFACYSLDTADGAAPIDAGLKQAAIDQCPKQCGYCCQTDAFNCANVQFPRLNCATITRNQCDSPAWRTIIAQDCPSACGFCNQGGCVDAVTNCANDLAICQTVGMQDFVNTYCQKTCARCPSTTTSSSGTATSTGTSGSCTSYAADTSSSCAAWAANGFCTNNFYTVAQRQARCATTCRLC